MYQNLEALNKEKHAGLRLQTTDNYGFTASLNTVPVVNAEVPRAAGVYPLVFLPADKGSVLPQALLGLNGFNIYLDDRQQWVAEYVPAFIRLYPFALAQAGESSVLAIDTAAPQLHDTDGEPLVENGQFTSTVTSAQELVTSLYRQKEVTENLLAELETAGVLVDKTLTVKNGRVIGGFRVVDKDRLLALDDATQAQWSRNGILEIVHHHLASLRHLVAVAERSFPPEQA